MVEPFLHDIIIGHTQVRDHFQAGDLLGSQDGILQILEKYAGGGCNKLVL